MIVGMHAYVIQFLIIVKRFTVLQGSTLIRDQV